MTTSRKKKKPSVSQLKKKLDALFSQFIRKKYADSSGYIQCYTCYKVALLSDMQCGHFIPRQHLSLRYSPENCRPQCVGCNVFGRGKIAEFGARLEMETPGVVARLFRESQKIIKDFPYASLIEQYGKSEHVLH